MDIQEFIKKNLLALVVYLVAIVVAWANLNARVLAVEGDYNEIVDNIKYLSGLTERIILVEERQLNLSEDIREIKEDVKDLKKHFEIK